MSIKTEITCDNCGLIGDVLIGVNFRAGKGERKLPFGKQGLHPPLKMGSVLHF